MFYEFLIDIESEGRFLKFEYRLGQDPKTVAQLFIDNNGLQQSSLSRIVNHLVENIPEINQYNGIDEPFLTSNGSFFIIYTLAVVILVISLVVGWKLPGLIGGSSEGSFRENDSDQQLPKVNPSNRFLPKIVQRKLSKNQNYEQSTELSGSFNDSMYQEEVSKAKEKCDYAVVEAELVFQQESAQLNKKFEHYKAKKSYDRAKKEADDKFDKGLKAAKKEFTFRETKIKEGDWKKTKEEEPKTNEDNKIKYGPSNNEDNKIKDIPKSIEVNKTEENDKTGVKIKINNLTTKVSSFFMSKVDRS